MTTYIPLVIMGIIVVVGRFRPGSFGLLFPAGIAVVLLVQVSLQIAIFRRTDSLELPNDYVSRFRLQSISVQIGNLVALSTFAYGISDVI